MEPLEDEYLKEMFAESKVELSNAEFDHSLMRMIFVAEKKKRARKMLAFFLTILVVEVIIFWTLWLNPNAVNTTLNLVLLPVKGLGILEQVAAWIFNNSYVVLPLLILLILRKLIEARDRFSITWI